MNDRRLVARLLNEGKELQTQFTRLTEKYRRLSEMALENRDELNHVLFQIEIRRRMNPARTAVRDE